MAGLVFVPVAAGELAAWAGSGSLAGPRRGFAATPAMLAAFGLAAGEDAVYTALCIAGMGGLLAHGERLVAVAEVHTTPGDAEFGEVSLDDVAWAAVTSLFAEGEDTAPARAAIGAIGRLGLAEAWEAPEVETLLAATDLLWYGPAEWVLLGR